MAFIVSFSVGDKQLGEILAAIHRFKIDDLDLRPLIVKGAGGKKGGIQAWRAVAAFATDAPKQAKEFKTALSENGYSIDGVSTALATAVKNGLMKKTAKGYIKAGGSK